jgi:hypothetical protein
LLAAALHAQALHDRLQVEHLLGRRAPRTAPPRPPRT